MLLTPKKEKKKWHSKKIIGILDLKNTIKIARNSSALKIENISIQEFIASCRFIDETFDEKLEEAEQRFQY